MQVIPRLPNYKERAGVVVDLGPESTKQFVGLHTEESMSQTFQRLGTVVRVPITMQYASASNEAERLLLARELNGKRLIHLFEQVFAASLLSSFETLESAGCTFAHLHCNTFGLFIEAFDLKEHFTKMEVLTIADTLNDEFKELKRLGVNNIFPIGTGMTVNGIKELSVKGLHGGMYDKAVQDAGLNFIKPKPSEQDIINRTILKCLHGESTIQAQVEIFEEILASKGIIPSRDSALLMCCTDLNAHGKALREKGYNVIDTAEIAVKSSVRRMVDSIS